jgi:hypothetical protein
MVVHVETSIPEEVEVEIVRMYWQNRRQLNKFNPHGVLQPELAGLELTLPLQQLHITAFLDCLTETVTQ